MELKDIERSIITTYRKKIWVPFIKGINDYKLINENDKIAVCISGGKDSFLLAKCMQEIKKHGKINFDLEFIVMDPGYNEENLKLAKELGYKTIFWSFAYVDWYNNQQPTHEFAKNKIYSRTHPGAIVLLHSNSQTNSEILDEVITHWEEEGYTLKSLDYLVNKK